MPFLKRRSGLDRNCRKERFCFSGSLLVFGACFAGFLLGFEDSGLQYILLKAAQEFHLSQAEMGSLVSIQFSAVTIAPLFMGAVSDRIGKKKVAVFFSMIFCLGAAVCVFSRSAAALGVGICGIGAAFSTLESTMTAAISDAYPRKSGTYISIMQGVLSLGAVVSPLTVSTLMSGGQIGWRGMFLMCSLIAFSLFLLLLFVRFPHKLPAKSDECGSMMLKDKLLIGVLAGIFLYVFLENGVAYFLDSFFSEVLKSGDDSAIALSGFWTAMAVSRLLVSPLGAFKTKIVPICFLASAVFLFLLGTAESQSLAVIWFIASGFFFGPIWPFLVSMANQKYPRHTGMVTSFVLTVGGIGGVLSPVLAGTAADLATLRVAFIGLGCAALAGFFLAKILDK